MNKNLIQVISLTELLLLIVLGILSNKVSEILQINQTFLWAATILIVAALIVITVYKNRQPESSRVDVVKKKLDIRITKKVVGGVMMGIIYYPAAIILSKGAFVYSKAIDDNWLGILSGSAVTGVLIFALFFLGYIREEKQSILPLTIGFLFSLVYGAIGIYIGLFPEFFNSNIFLLAMISATTFVGLKYVFLYYTFFTWFGKWYKGLPEG